MVTLETALGKLVYVGGAVHAGFVPLPDVPLRERLALMAELLQEHREALDRHALVTVRRRRIRVTAPWRSDPRHRPPAVTARDPTQDPMSDWAGASPPAPSRRLATPVSACPPTASSTPSASPCPPGPDPTRLMPPSPSSPSSCRARPAPDRPAAAPGTTRTSSTSHRNAVALPKKAAPHCPEASPVSSLTISSISLSSC